YLGSRGTFEEGYPGETAATLVHGLFDDVPIVATELVNTPSWIRLMLFIDGERFRLDQGNILDYHRSLNLRNGVLRRFVRWQSPNGKTIEVTFERVASLADPHRAAVRLSARALDFDALVELRADLPGHTDNEGFLHWDWVDQGQQDQQSAYLRLETKASHVALGQAFHLAVQGDEPVEYIYWDSDWTPTLVARTHLQKGREVVAEKLVVTYTGRDADDPLAAARAELQAARAGGYARLLAANEAAWATEWEASNITIEGDDEADRALRYSLFQLLIAAPRRDERVSIAAKTLSGYGYRGHVFWDTEIFMLPFFIYTQPEIARNLLLYRYHTLPGARRKALKNGSEGAMFAWESAGSGDETTPRWVPSPEGEELIRIWCGDIEHHITADIAYAVMQYWRAAGDDDFMLNYGAEMVLDSARFWDSRAEWNAERGVYEITDVIGPDEYHDHVDNNAFTNLMARWNIRAGFDVLAWLKEFAPARFAELTQSLDLSPARLAHWEDVEAKIFRGYDPQTQLFEQFEGYFDLRYQDLENYEPRTISMQALLGIEGVQDYQYIKQPDVVMMLFLLRGEFNPEVIRANYDYYSARTDLTYGSSLGPAVQALLAARYGKLEDAYRHFMHAARTDLEDARRNAEDGIHGATAGGLWQAVVFGFAGLSIQDGRPTVKPTLPAHWRRLSFNLMVHGQRY
ncbi:MAG TPA: glycosyl hydrolase family 65 protein, partial [Anaerolineales bacterium]|nr:glycosyl hydrolase family 65 protein [Anaerolineales bacterium]